MLELPPGVVISRALLCEVLALLAQVDLHFENTDAPMGVTARELIQKILTSNVSNPKEQP
jgi:hypothetical protein